MKWNKNACTRISVNIGTEGSDQDRPDSIEALISEPRHGKTNLVEGVPSEDSDQTGQLPSLIRVFVVRLKVR